MNEIREILDRVADLAEGERGVLATVIDVRGSGYRLPGARMLILSGGETFGTVSGGCLEADMLERAKRVLKTGRSEVFTYDTTEDETSVFSMNMGCRGVIRILLEAVDRESPILSRLRSAMEDQRRQAIATLVSCDNGEYIGGRAYCDQSLQSETNRLPESLVDPKELQRALSAFFKSGLATDSRTFESPAGSFEFAFEALEPPVAVLLFGAGADAVPFVRIASELGWRVAVYDHRPAFLTDERFPSAKKLVLLDPQESPKDLPKPPRTAAVIMTHNYARDRQILPQLLSSEFAYIGMLGPKRRTEQLLEELAAAGKNFTDEQLGRLYAPVGLDIGADTPEAIALAIVGEIQSVLKARDGGHLRERQGSIYDREHL